MFITLIIFCSINGVEIQARKHATVLWKLMLMHVFEYDLRGYRPRIILQKKKKI